MTFDGRYVASEAAFKEDAFAALSSRFTDRQAFEMFYATLGTPARKDDFLRVSSFYLFLVKQGDWCITVPGYDQVIDYYTNSFKLVALFSLIESLTEVQHQDFFQWLSSQNSAEVFPITNKTDLERLHGTYKRSYGSIRRCVSFFERLPAKQKTRLCESIQPGGTPISNIKKLAEHLYQLRSKFVHEAQFVLQIGETPMFSFEKSKVTRNTLTVPILLEAFEEGVLAYFNEEAKPVI